MFTFSTDQPQVVEFKAKSFRVFGKIEATKDSSISIIVKDRANPSKTRTFWYKYLGENAGYAWLRGCIWLPVAYDPPARSNVLSLLCTARN